MSDPDDFSFSERNKRAKSTVNVPPPGDDPAPPPPPPRDFTPPPSAEVPRKKKNDDEEGELQLPVDPWRFLMAFKRRWRQVVWAGGAGLLLGCVIGYFVSYYKIRVTLILRDVTAPFEAGVGGESFKPHPLTVQTLVSLMDQPVLIQRVSAKSRPFVSARALQKRVSVQPERNMELVHLVLAGQDKLDLVELANLYANEAVQFTKEVQLQDLSRSLKSYSDKLHETGEEIQKADLEMKAFVKEYKILDPNAETRDYQKQLSELIAKIEGRKLEAELLDLQITNLQGTLAQQSPLAQQIEAAREDLRKLRIQYQDAWPAVQNKLHEIEDLEKQFAGTLTNAGTTRTNANTPSGRDFDLRTRKSEIETEIAELRKLKDGLQAKMMTISESATRYTLIKARQDSLQKKMTILSSRQSETQFYYDKADGYYRLLAPATWRDLDGKSRWLKTLLIALVGAVLALLGAALVVVVAEITDDRLKTAADVKRVTGLPVLATLGDLDQMTPAEKESWAFRTWTALSGQMSRSANHGMVCGFISSTHGEGRSTWINLLVDAASQRGLRVLTITTRPSPTDLEELEKAAAETEKQFGAAVAEAIIESDPHMPSTAVTMTAKALAFPAEVSQKFSGPNALPSAHIALPGWVWNLERRKQFQRALAHWRMLDNMVLLVELPPASVPEAVLLAENLPQLIWLADSGRPRARDTRQQLETLRHARCRLVGAVLNHEPKPVFQL